MLSKIFLPLLFCLSIFQLNAQADEIPISFDAAVNALKTGGLVVLLPTQAKTIAAMEETLADGQLSIRGRQNLEERLLNTKTIAKRDQEWMVSLFKTYYKAGDIYFIYDTDWSQLKAATVNGYFLDDHLEFDANISRPTSDYLILRKASPDQANYQAKEALIVYDQNGGKLPPKFPSVSGLTAGVWTFISTKERVDQSRYKTAVMKLSNRLRYLLEKHED